jgi:flagellar motor component MotA
MNRTEFIERYTAFLLAVLPVAQLARRQGLLSLSCDNEKVKDRDVFEYGMSFVIDGIAPEFIEKILNNIIAQEKDEYARIYKTVQKEAVMGIQQGLNPDLLYSILNSLTDLPLKDDDGYLYAMSL